MDSPEQIEQDQLMQWSELNRLADEQSKQGLSQPLDDQDVITRLQERLAKQGIRPIDDSTDIGSRGSTH